MFREFSTPTAQQFADEVQRTLSVCPGGCGASDQLLPFQCRICPPSEVSPTAQQSPAETQVTE
jgi:hypothetical protein